jgi:ribosome-associated protein
VDGVDVKMNFIIYHLQSTMHEQPSTFFPSTISPFFLHLHYYKVVMIRDIDFSSEWFFRTSRSSGSGGQNVNKVSSKVELCFNVQKSTLLSDEEKELISINLGHRISLSGLLRISSEKDRSQLGNKKIVIEKFYILLEKALTIPEERFATKPTRSSVRKRLKEKVIISEKKQRRKLIIKEE